MSLRLLGSLAVASSLTLTAISQDSSPSAAPAEPQTPTAETRLQQPDPALPRPESNLTQVVPEEQPELNLKPVPPLVRMHLPMLGPAMGLLVDSVSPDSAPAKVGLVAGDILIEAGGQTLFSNAAPPPFSPGSPILVIRRGRIIPLLPMDNAPWGLGETAGQVPGTWQNWPNVPMMRNMPMMPGPQAAGVSGHAVASSFSGTGGGVSFSRAGNQIAIDIRPQDGEPVQLRGTREEIERSLKTGTLSPAMENQVRSLLEPRR